VRDNNETGVDCGGSGCQGCFGGGQCSASGDCLSQICAASVCLAPSSNLIGTLSITSDWGAGYCANINALNIGTSPTTSWAVTIDTRQTTIYQTAQAAFSATSGTVLVTPQVTQLVVAPGATNSQLNFCANRPSGNTTALPLLLSTTGSY
jgi:cellulase/cellobiase CelA1